MRTATLAIAPPQTSEYAPYYGRYISLVKNDDILAALREQARATKALLSSLSQQQRNNSSRRGLHHCRSRTASHANCERPLSSRIVCSKVGLESLRFHDSPQN